MSEPTEASLEHLRPHNDELAAIFADEAKLAAMADAVEAKYDTLAAKVWENVEETVRGLYDGEPFPAEVAHLSTIGFYGPGDQLGYLQARRSPFDTPEGVFRTDHLVPREDFAGVGFNIPTIRLRADMLILVAKELGAHLNPIPERVIKEVCDRAGEGVMYASTDNLRFPESVFLTGWDEEKGESVISFQDSVNPSRGRHF